MKLACNIHLMSGTFASQPLAFAHLLDAAQTQRVSLDLDNIEVLQPPHGPRLSQWFAPAICASLPADLTLVAFLPGSGGPLAPTPLLATLGAFPATITRAALPRDTP